MYLETLSLYWHEIPPSGFRFLGEKGTSFYCCERVVQKQEFQTHSNVKKANFFELDGFSHHFVLNITFFTSSSFPFSWFFIMKKGSYCTNWPPISKTHARCLRRPFCGMKNTYSCVEHATALRSEENKRNPTETFFYHIHAVPGTVAESRNLICSIRRKETPSRLSSFQMLI